MKQEEFNKKIKDLIKEIAKLPTSKQKKLGSLVQETEKRQTEITNNIEEASKSLDDLRIYLKYLLFDLEATRRERDQLRDQLDDNDN